MNGQNLPRGLSKGGAGQKFWNELTARVEFTDVELRILTSACFTLDRIAKERRVIGGDLVVEGSRGQLVAHPLLTELRADERHFADLVKRLDIPDEFAQQASGTESGNRAAQMRAVANSRWSRQYG